MWTQELVKLQSFPAIVISNSSSSSRAEIVLQMFRNDDCCCCINSKIFLILHDYTHTTKNTIINNYYTFKVININPLLCEVV